MSTKRKSPFAVEGYENANHIKSIDNILSSHILQIIDPNPSLRLKSLTVISAHLNYASFHFVTQTIKPSLEHQLWHETNPQVAQHIIKILADIANHKNIDKNNNDNDNILSTVDIFHKFLDANQFSDDFITTQIVSSLIYIVQEKGLFRVLDRVLALNLLCSNKAGLRAKVLNLLALTTTSKESESGGDGSIVFKVFEVFTKDPYASVRKAALDGLVAMHKKGYQLSTGCYMRACALLQDKDELVKLSAIKVICNYVDVLHQISEGHTTNQINQAFLQLCALSRDMDTRVRSEALEALGRMGPSESVLLQALCKRVLGQTTKKTCNETVQGDERLVNCGEGLNLLTISAAGALLHGVEDEFYEVRIATIHSLARLSRFSKQFADSALDLLMDLLNDDSLDVRMQTLDGLLHMGQTGHLTVQEQHMHMFLGMLEDINHDIRSATRKLFVHTKLSSMLLFKMSIEALLTNLDKHPQDEQDIIYVMYHMGKIHSTFVECFVNEFVQQIITCANGELGLDHPHVPTLLILLMAAQISNVGICYQIPEKVLSYAKYFIVKFHHILFESSEITKGTNPPLKDFDRWSQNSYCKGSCSSSAVPNQEEDDEMVEKRCQDTGSETIELTPNFMALHMQDRFAYDFANWKALVNVTDMPEKRQNENYLLHKSKILHSVANIVRVVAGTWSFLKQKPVIYIFKTLRECRQTLRKLERNFEGSISQISFASLYTRSIHFLIKIWVNLTPTSKHSPQSVKDSLQHMLENLEKAVRRMKNCYLGLCEEQELRILELNVLVYLLKLSFLGVNEPYVFRRLQCLIFSVEFLYEGDGLRHSQFLLKIKKQLSDEDTKSISFLKLIQELPEHLSLQPIPLGKLKEIKAELVIPNNSYEHPFRFIPGMPLGIPMHITLHNMTGECRIWIVMVLGELIQYNFLDFSEFQGPGRKKCGTVTLPFYSNVNVASCFLEVSVTLECPFEFERVSSSTIRSGPKGHLVSLTTVEKVNLVARV